MVAKLAAQVRDLEIDERFDALEQTIECNRQEVASAHTDLRQQIEKVAVLLGEPPEAANGPTGLFKLVSRLDGRIAPFEALRHKAIGAIMVSGPMLCGFGIILYFLEGDRLKTLFAH